MIHHTRVTITTLCLFIVTSFSSAQALTISFSDNWSTSDSVNTGSNSSAARTDILNDTDTLAVSLFDSAIGILNSVRVIFEDTRFTSSAAARFRDTDVGQRTAGTQRLSNLGVSITFNGINYNRTRSTRSDTCSSGIGGINGATCTTSIGSSTSTFSTQNTLFTDATTLANFIGGGNAQGTVRQSGTLFTDETNGDDGFIDSRSGSVSASGRLRVIYDYTEHPPVPLPAAFWLFASALTGMIYFRRRTNN